jgi:hypothetical protein
MLPDTSFLISIRDMASMEATRLEEEDYSKTALIGWIRQRVSKEKK